MLGAGGPVGHAFHAGALLALAQVNGFDPRGAHVIVGTSAGAQVGALLRAGLTAEDLYARARGAPMTAAGSEIARGFRRPDFGRSRRWGWPAAPGYLLGTLARPWRLRRVGMLAAAGLPAGQVDLSDLAAGIRGQFEAAWPERGLWVCAANLDTGQRVVFGRTDAPVTDVGTAVAASSAVPSLCRPVEVDGARYVDGGMLSTHNADSLRETDVDEVVISSPLSRFVGLRGVVRRSAARLQATGRRVRCLEPDATVSAAMGFNVMDTRRAPKVAEAALESVSRALKTDPLR